MSASAVRYLHRMKSNAAGVITTQAGCRLVVDNAIEVGAGEVAIAAPGQFRLARTDTACSRTAPCPYQLRRATNVLVIWWLLPGWVIRPFFRR